MPITYDCITTTTLSNATNIVDFTGIDQSYTDLVMIIDLSYASLGANTGYPTARVGSGSFDTGSNYSFSYIRGDGSSGSSGRGLSAPYFNILGTVTGTNKYSAVINFQNYSNTVTFKTMLWKTVSTGWDTLEAVNLWRSTNNINQIRIYDFSGYNFAVGSIFTLYGIKAA